MTTCRGCYIETGDRGPPLGNLWVAVRDETKPGIWAYSPTGEELAYIKTEIPTNVGFGRGDELSTLYITAGTSLYRIPVKVEGYHLP